MPARVVGTQKWRRVAEEDRGTEQGYSAVSSLPLTLVRPRTGGSRTARTVARTAGRGGRSLAWARVARLCLSFKWGGEIAGLGRIGGEKWCGRGDDVGRVWGWMGQGRERVARESDVFFGNRGARETVLGAPCNLKQARRAPRAGGRRTVNVHRECDSLRLHRNHVKIFHQCLWRSIHG